MAGRDTDHPGDVRRVHLDLTRDLGEERRGVAPRGNGQEADVGHVAVAVHAKTSTADPIAWVSSGRSVSPSTKLLSAVSRLVVVIVIGCLRPGASRPRINDFSQMKSISWKRRYSSLQSSAIKISGWSTSCRGTWSRRTGRAAAARGSGPRSP